ncbi:MAG: translation initiation factor IF-2 [Clostridia bacterium]|nr:translation initiation factor IF-2 [Clostridia bacterium]
MTNVKSKGATKELAVDAQKVLSDATRVRKGADSLVQSLKKLENRFQREKEEAAAQLRREEQQKAIASHSKAFTMLDDEDKAQIAAAEAAAAKAAEEKAAAEAAAAKAAQEKAAAEAAAAKAAEEKAAAEAAAAKAAEEKVKAAAAKASEPKKPAIGQIISRPGQQAQPAKPVGLAPNVIRAPQPARPVQQGQGQQGARPAGPYGRPANPQGPYGRPANPQGQQGPYGRPANPQGPYGRPANPQGPYGRPANPQGQQGQFGRPAQGGAARPQGSFAQRPAGAPGQGGFGQRPAPGGAPRPGMGGGRPQGGMSRSKGPELAPPMEKERVSNYDPNKKNYVRQHDPERVTRNRKQEARNNFNGYDDDVIRGGKRSRVKKPSAQQMMAPIKIETAYMAGDTIVVRDLCEKIGKTSGEIIKKLFLLGNMATINSEIDFDTAQLVCSDFEITLERKAEQTAEDALVAEDFDDTEENLQPRPPVVTIMGHVDHGKTSLLDYIRSSRVTAGEAGGITQHIGAYTVDVDGQAITFLDTPGHEAFTAMRARGTQATDIAVLVVAADDSVMPQTVESINHAKAAEVPVIVAINKMDKPTANPERVKQDLTNYGIVCEDWGGDTICVPVSALTGDGVDELLEMILMQAEMLELRANPNRLAKGVIVEAKLDKARGPLATVLLQNGTLHVGDNIIAGLAAGRVRALINDRGEKVQSAGPSMPVEIMGFDEVPSAGDEMIAVGDDHLSRKVADERREKLRASREATAAKMSMENLFSSLEEGKTVTLNLIIKADVQGSVEAVKQAMLKLTNDEVKVRVLHSGAGAVTKDDVNLASAFNAIIIGFNVRPDASAREAAEKEKVDVRLYTIIYKAIEDMEKAMKGLLEPEYKEVLLGHAEVRNVFKITGAGIIAGCYVQDGKVQRNAQVRLLRDNVVVFEGKLSSLRHLKEDVKEMKEGFECGMSLEGHNDIKEGDIVECFIMEEIPR